MENQLPAQGEKRIDEAAAGGGLNPAIGPMGSGGEGTPAAGTVGVPAAGEAGTPAAFPPLKPGPVVTIKPVENQVQDKGTIALGMYNEMCVGIRGWAGALILIGGIQLLISGWDPLSWGSVLILVGLASFLFREASMYVIYAVTICWAAFNNLISGEFSWIGFAVLQVYIAVQLFRRFSNYRTARSDYEATLTGDNPVNLAGKDRAAGVFPWAGVILGALALANVLLFWGAIFYFAFQGTRVPQSVSSVFAKMMIDLSVLGVAVSLAALLARYRSRAVSIVGLVASGISSLVVLGTVILGILKG